MAWWRDIHPNFVPLSTIYMHISLEKLVFVIERMFLYRNIHKYVTLDMILKCYSILYISVFSKNHSDMDILLYIHGDDHNCPEIGQLGAAFDVR